MGIIATYSQMVQEKKTSRSYVYFYLLRENDKAKVKQHLGNQDEGYMAVLETLYKSKIILKYFLKINNSD